MPFHKASAVPGFRQPSLQAHNTGTADDSAMDYGGPFCKFVGARGVTMVIEVAGVWFFAEIIHMNDMAGKFITQFVVLALNYIFSKFLVFTSGRKS